ncbi:MAG: Rrf2 family transcriptional regulator [Pseudomonadales bacterium]|nr:Rrf2 family transcriptional regulator [Pseudomonadales bacterium]
MHLTKHTDISLRVLMYLGINKGEICNITDIAKKVTVSRNHLVKVVHKLATFGYIKSVQGRGGGIFIDGDLTEIRVGDVVRDMEANLTIVDCSSRCCPLTPSCILKRALDDATRAFMKCLDSYTLDDLIRNKRTLVRLIG